MAEYDELHRLMETAGRGMPAQEGRLPAVYARAARMRVRRRALRGSGVAVVGVTAALLLVVPGGSPGSREQLTTSPSGTSSSSPQASATSEPSAPATWTPGPTGTPARTSPGATPPGTTAPTVPTPFEVTPSALLSTGYVDAAFGGGRAAQVSTITDPLPGLLRSCYHVLLPADAPERFVARSWYWPGEVVVSQVLAREPSRRDATARERACADPTSPDFDRDAAFYPADGGSPREHRVDLGEYGVGHLVVVPRALDTAAYAVARVDDTVLVLVWRQTGAITDPSALEQALVSATRKAGGHAQGSPLAAPHQRVPAVLDGFLTRSRLPQPVPWLHDEQAGSAALRCADGSVTTVAPPVARQWSKASDGSPETNQSVVERFARATDAGAAASGFAACKQAYVDSGAAVSTPVGLPGDESFVADLTPELAVVVVRSGPAYLEVTCAAMPYEQLSAIAHDALTALSTAGRLS